MGVTALLLTYAAGLGCAPFLELSPLTPLLPLLAALIWLPCRRRKLGSLLLALFLWTLGIAFYHLATTPPTDPDHIRAFVGEQTLIIEGAVLTVANQPAGRTTIDLEAQRVGNDGILAPAHGKLRLYLDEPLPGAAPGTVLRFRSRLRAPRTFGTPGEFDYSRQLAGQQVFAVASLEHAREVAVFSPPDAAGRGVSIAGLRSRLIRFIDELLPPDSATLVKALVVGDKGGITAHQRDLLARGGVSHLFAISGLHLGLIAVFLYAAALWFYRRSEPLMLLAPPRRALPLFLLPLLLAYLLLTGNALPTRRAFLMTMAGGILAVGARRTRPLRLLASAALLILLFEPLAIFAPAFQLSFAGVLGMIILLPRWQSRLGSWPAPLRHGALLLLTTLAATVATTPLVLLHFHILAPAGLLTNLFAVPAIGFLAVPLGLLGGLLSPFWADGATLLLQGCGQVVEAVLGAVRWLIAWPLLSGWRVYLAPLQIAGVAALCAIPGIAGQATRAWLARGGLLAAGLLLLCWPTAVPAPLSVTAFSVGQGDAMLVTRAGNRHYLVDGGGLRSETFDVGERLLAPALGRLGVAALEAVILTHDHPDHRQGLIHVLEHFKVKAFWSSQPLAELDPQLVGILGRRQIPTRTFEPGWTVLEASGDETLALFAPAATEGDLNDRSLVLYARQGDDGILLTGDLQKPGVGELLATPAPGVVNLLKLPHHGSRKSSPELLCERYRPQLAFVSLGAGNPYHFPHTEVLEELDRRGIPLYRTDRLGSLRFLSEGRGWRVQHWQQGLFH